MNTFFKDNEAQLTNLRLFQWNDVVSKQSVPLGNGLFVFNVLTFNKDGILNNQENDYKTSTLTFELENLYNVNGNYTAFAEEAIKNTSLFNHCSKITLENLVNQVSDYVKSLFTFKKISIDSPKLVFVAYITLLNDTNKPEFESKPKSESESEFELRVFSLEPTPVDIVSYFNNKDYSDIQSTGWGDSDNLSEFKEISIDHGTYNNQNVAYNFDSDFDSDSDSESYEDEYKDEDEETKKTIFSLKSWVLRNGGNLREKIKLTEVLPNVLTLQATRDEVHVRENLCSICLDLMLMDEEDLVRIVGGDHVYHKRCIVNWLPTNQSCPYCRSNILLDVTI